jgi:hypothetical protein
MRMAYPAVGLLLELVLAFPPAVKMVLKKGYNMLEVGPLMRPY